MAKYTPLVLQVLIIILLNLNFNSESVKARLLDPSLEIIRSEDAEEGDYRYKTEPVPNTTDGGGGEVPIQPDPNPDLETTNDVNARRTSDTTITRANEADNDVIDQADTKLIDTSEYLPEEDLDGTQFIIEGEPNEITVNIDNANTVGQTFERMENIEEWTNQIAEHIEATSTDINGNAHEQPTSDNDIEEQQQGEIENIDANEREREEELEEREPEEEVNEIEESVEMPTKEIEPFSNDHQEETDDEETIEEEIEGANNEHNVEEITDEMSGEASVIETEDNENQPGIENYIEPLEDIEKSHDIENTNTIEHVTEESEEEVEPPNEVEETMVEHEDEMEVEENDEEEEAILAEEALRQYIHDLDEDTVGEEGEDDPQITENESNERIIVINNDEHLPVVNYLKNENEIIVNTEEPADILSNDIFEETDDIPELEEMYTQYLEQQRIKYPRRIQADIKDVEFSWHDKVEKADEMDEGFYDSDEDINPPGALHDIQTQPVESHGNDIEVPDEPDLCKFPAKTGFCKARLRRYFFNDETKQCEPFYYGGCGGNANNFQTLQDCLNACKPTVSL